MAIASTPRNYVSLILDGKIVVEQATPEVERLARSHGGHAEQRKGETAWIIPAADDLSLAAVLAELRDQGAVFGGAPSGWPPAEVFADLRDRGLLSGPFTEAVSYGAGHWTIRQR